MCIRDRDAVVIIVLHGDVHAVPAARAAPVVEEGKLERKAAVKVVEAGAPQMCIRDRYKDHSETIMGNMDSIVFLGGREASTLKDISENWLGKATISCLLYTSVGSLVP